MVTFKCCVDLNEHREVRKQETKPPTIKQHWTQLKIALCCNEMEIKTQFTDRKYVLYLYLCLACKWTQTAKQTDWVNVSPNSWPQAKYLYTSESEWNPLLMFTQQVCVFVSSFFKIAGPRGFPKSVFTLDSCICVVKK